MEIPVVNRRNFLVGGALAGAVTALDMSGKLTVLPQRPAEAAGTPSDIQFDIGPFSAAPTTIEGLQVALQPVHTMFLTARLLRRPNGNDQNEMKRVLAQLETSYPWGASSLFTFVAYGQAYFNRLSPFIVNAAIPGLDSNPNRKVLQTAVPGPTDVHRNNPNITKQRFNVPVVIENNDLLFTLRSDNANNLSDVIAWFNGSNRLRGATVTSPRWANFVQFTSSRHMFQQRGLPRATATQANLGFQNFLDPGGIMWMNFADQQPNAAGPSPIVTFAGNADSHKTTARPGSYFDTGSIQVLSHVILDMLQFFDMASPTAAPDDDGVYTERVQYMFHSPAINPGRTDQLTNGGGPSFLPNEFRGTGEARNQASGATTGGEKRIGHLASLHRSSRTSSGIPLHIRMDGPGFDGLDVPGGAATPKLEFTAFVPTSDFFATLRVNQASLDLVNEFEIDEDENSLERFLTATRRQNFLIPPRRNRAFPLIELGA